MKLILVLIFLVFNSSLASAAGDAAELKQKEWSFDGAFGKYDRQSAQRGYQVYREVCAACHSMRLKSYRNLSEIGFSEGEIKTIAAEYTVIDGPNDEGEMFERPARPSDRYVSPYPNEKAARASNGGAYPPDLSLMIKARPDGANYMYSLLTGYEDAPKDMKMGTGMYYNKYYPGYQIAMPSPLSDGLVTYGDGTEATLERMSVDLTNFLQWAAEPEMEHRKSMGIKVMIYLFIFTILFYMAKVRIWGRLK